MVKFIYGLSLILFLSVSLNAQDISNVYPTYIERWLLMGTNEVRNDPGPWGYGNMDKVPPVNYNLDLAEASRYHAEDMFDNNCFQHESCDGTSFPDRIARFYSGYDMIGENIAAGQTSVEMVLQAWMDSKEGHRENLMDSAWNELGTGFAASLTWGVSNQQWVQDFGHRSSVFVDRVPAGVSYQIETYTYRFAANYYHQAGGAPQLAQVVINGKCFSLSLYVGSETQGTYEAQVVKTDFGNATPVYRFEFTDSLGIDVIYPADSDLTIPSNIHSNDLTARDANYPTCSILYEDPGNGGDDDGGGSSGCSIESWQDRANSMSLFWMALFILMGVFLKKRWPRPACK